MKSYDVPPPYAVSSPCDVSPSNLVYISPQYIVVPPATVDINQINDWLIWSVINLIVGWGSGLLPLIFSLICRSNKSNNDMNGARTMSTLALVFNILATVGGLIAWISLLVVLIFFWSLFSVGFN